MKSIAAGKSFGTQLFLVCFSLFPCLHPYMFTHRILFHVISAIFAGSWCPNPSQAISYHTPNPKCANFTLICVCGMAAMARLCHFMWRNRRAGPRGPILELAVHHDGISTVRLLGRCSTTTWHKQHATAGHSAISWPIRSLLDPY